jgi:hypothetical protein
LVTPILDLITTFSKAQLKIETGRYERKELNERLCINCDNLEDEKHVLLKCPLYGDLRQSMFIAGFGNRITNCIIIK